MSIDEIATLFFLKLNTIELNYSQQELIDFGLQSIYSKRKISEATRELSEDFSHASRALQLHNDFPVYLTAVACCAGLGNIAERKVCTDKRL